MASINTVALSGVLAQDPNIRWGEEDGKCSVTFRAAVTTSLGKGDDGRERTRTEMVPCRAYDALGEALYNSLKKGNGIALAGSIRVEEYEKNGEKRSILMVDVATFMGVTNPKEIAGPLVTMNTATISGNLARDPELKRFENGGTQATFTVAVNTYLGRDAQRTEWVVVRANGKLAEAIVSKFRKGMPITVSGTLKIDSYEKDQERRTFSYISATTVDQWPKAKSDEIPHGDRYQGARSTQDRQESHDDGYESPDDDPTFSDSDEIPF